MITARCVGAAGLLFAASRWLGPDLEAPGSWPLVAAAAAALVFLLPGRPRVGEARSGAGSRAGLAALAVWLPWALAVDAPLARILAPGAFLCVSAGLAVVGGRAAGTLLLGLVGGAVLLGAGGHLAPDAGGDGFTAARARGAWRIVEVPLELRGPLQGASLGHDGYPTLEVRADLLEGERAAATAWVVEPASSEIVDAGPPVLLGQARPAGGSVRAGAPRPQRAHPGWARRPLPAPDVPGNLPLSPAAALLAATAALLAGVIAADRRLQGAAAPASLIALAVAAAFGVRVLAGGPGEAAGEGTGAVVVLEGRARASGGLEWAVSARVPAPLVEDAGRPSERPGAAILLTDPAGPLRTELVLDGGAAERGLLTRTPRVGVDRVTAGFDPGLRLLRPEVNTLVPLEQVWTRQGPGEAWAAAGSWPLGESLPAGAEGAEGPPGWALSGLPMGEPVLVGRVAPGAPLGTDLLAEVGLEASSTGAGGASPGPGASLWVRVVGFGR